MNELVVKDNKVIVPEEAIKTLRKLEEKRLEAEMAMKSFKADLLDLMESNGIKEGFEVNGLKVTYKKASQRTTLDSKKIKEDLPDIYEKYSKTSDVSSSVSLEFLW